MVSFWGETFRWLDDFFHDSKKEKDILKVVELYCMILGYMNGGFKINIYFLTSHYGFKTK